MEEVEENAAGRGEHFADDESSDDPVDVPVVVDLTEPSTRNDEAVREELQRSVGIALLNILLDFLA